MSPVPPGVTAGQQAVNVVLRASLSLTSRTWGELHIIVPDNLHYVD